MFSSHKGRRKKGSGRCFAGKRPEGILGQWRQESPFRETLEQVRTNAVVECCLPDDAKRLLCNEGR